MACSRCICSVYPWYRYSNTRCHKTRKKTLIPNQPLQLATGSCDFNNGFGVMVDFGLSDVLPNHLTLACHPWDRAGNPINNQRCIVRSVIKVGAS